MFLFDKINNTFLNLNKARSHKYVRRESDGKGGWNYFYSKDGKISNNDKIDQWDIRRFGYKKAIEIHAFMSLISEDKAQEHSRCYDPSGEIILTKSGEKDNIQYNKDDIVKIKRAVLHIHNHPSGVSFSPEDVVFAILTGIKEIRVCTTAKNSGITYSLVLRNPIDDEDKKIKLIESYKFHQEKVAKSLNDQYSRGEISTQYINENYKHLTMTSFCNRNKEYIYAKTITRTL